MDSRKLTNCEHWRNVPAFLTSEQYLKNEILVAVIKDEYKNELKNSVTLLTFILIIVLTPLIVI